MKNTRSIADEAEEAMYRAAEAMFRAKADHYNSLGPPPKVPKGEQWEREKEIDVLEKAVYYINEHIFNLKNTK